MLKLIIKGQEVLGCLIDGGLGVNVISKSTCDRLGIQDWKKLFFWLRMTDTRSIRLLDLIRKLEIVVGSYAFEISAIVLALEAPGAYPLLLGRPWLRSANIKQNWQHNHLGFRRGRAKIRVPMQESAPTAKEISPLYVQ